MFDLAGRTALVTGASGGIGTAIAETLIAANAKVVVHGTRREALDELAHRLGPMASVVTGNLAEADAADGVIKDAESALGASVDILVNNAGITRDQLALRMKDEDWDQVLAVNLTSGFRLCRAAMRGMMKKRWGRIVNITSVVGHTGNAGQANYAASKAGMLGMSKALAAELASRGITVNCIAPGYIATAMTDAISDDQKAKLSQAIPVGRMGSPADIATAALFLSSEEAGYVTGTTLHVNGGLAMI